MDITTRVFFKINAFVGPGRIKIIKEANINCTKGYDIYNFNIQSGMQLKTTTELLQEVQDFCKNLKCDDPVYGDRAYKIGITKNVIVFINGITRDFYWDTQVRNFIFNKSNRLLYPSDVCDMYNTENLCVWDPKHRSCDNKKYGNRSSDDDRYVIKHKGQMNPYVPLFVDMNTDSYTFVTPIEKNCFVVNSDFQEIYPKLTWKYPKALIDMLENKTELIRQINRQDISR